MRPLILERSIPGAEASSAAAGILAAQIHQRPGAMFELGIHSRELYAEFSNEIEELSGVDVGYRRCGLISLGETTGPYRWQIRLGLRVEKLDGADLRRLEPALGPRHRRGLYFPDEAQVDSPRLARALSLAAARAGCAFRSDLRVLRIVSERNRVTRVDLENTRLSTNTVVLAAGAWSSLVEGSGLKRNAVQPVRGQVVQVETRPPLLSRIVFSPNGYAVPLPDGRLILGSTIEKTGFQKRVTVDGVLSILRTGREIAPSVGEATVTETWAGFRPYTDDELPILGASRIAGLYVCTGHFRGGVLLAPASARALAALITAGQSPYEIGPFTPARYFRRH